MQLELCLLGVPRLPCSTPACPSRALARPALPGARLRSSLSYCWGAGSGHWEWWLVPENPGEAEGQLCFVCEARHLHPIGFMYSFNKTG